MVQLEEREENVLFGRMTLFIREENAVQSRLKVKNAILQPKARKMVFELCSEERLVMVIFHKVAVVSSLLSSFLLRRKSDYDEICKS